MSISPVQSGERSLAKRVGRKCVEGNNRPSVLLRASKNKFETETSLFKVYFTKRRALKDELYSTRLPLSISVCPSLDSPPLPHLGMVQSAAAALTRPGSLLYLPGGSRTRCARRERAPTGAFVCGV